MKTKLFLLLNIVFFGIQLNAQTQVATGINIGIGLDYDGNHLYVAELFGNKISRLDINVGTSSLETVTTINRPEGLAINGNEVYMSGISLPGSFRVADISGGIPATNATILAASSIRTIVYDDTWGLYLIQDTGSGTRVYSVTGNTATLITTTTVADVRGVTIYGSEMYLSSRGGGSIYKFDLSNVATPTLVKSGLNQPYEIEVANNDLYFASEGGFLGKFDLNNTTAAPTFFVNNTLGDLAGLEIIGEDIYFTSWGNNAIYKVNDPDLAPCVIAIPDTNFKNYLIGNNAININGDTEIQCSEASAFTGIINVSSLSISDLTGIEAFTALTELDSRYNTLTTLDVTQNTTLTKLLCTSNNLTSLNVTQNTALLTLYCDVNTISSIDVSQNILLEKLNCGFNSLTSLDVTSNVNLLDLFCPGNQLTVLNVINNTNLTQLGCYENQLVVLNLSTNPNLTFLACYENQISTLDFSSHSSLGTIFCRDNQLTSLNVANGNNANIPSGLFAATNNPNLTCITVDDVAYSNANWTNIDTQTSFSTNCTVGVNDYNLENISIYPNPVNDILTIELAEGLEKVEVYSLHGQKLLKSTESTINVAQFSTGMYLLKVLSTSGNIGFKRFIKR